MKKIWAGITLAVVGSIGFAIHVIITIVASLSAHRFAWSTGDWIFLVAELAVFGVGMLLAFGSVVSGMSKAFDRL